MDKLQQIVIGAVAGAVAILAAGWFLLVHPQYGKAADLKSQTQSEQGTAASLQQQLARLKSDALDYADQQLKLQDVQMRMPVNSDVPDLINQLSQAAADAGVDLQTITPGDPVAAKPPAAAKPSAAAAASAAAPASAAAAAAPSRTSTTVGGFTRTDIPLSIAITGSYPQVEKFLQQSQSMQRLFTVSDVSIKPGTTTGAGNGAPASAPAGALLTVSISGTVYSLTMPPVPQPPLSSAAPSSGK